MTGVSVKDLNSEQVNNLSKLATYLENLPEKYKRFDMCSFMSSPPFKCIPADQVALATYIENQKEVPCGTVACAVGHGPAAGVELNDIYIEIAPNSKIYVDWDGYSEKFIPQITSLWEWCFGSDWESIDNTHRGAAARIRYVLNGNEVPCKHTYRRGKVLYFGLSTRTLRSRYSKYRIRGDKHIKVLT